MGKSKQNKEKKFDRNVEISAPILDPEIIKAIHTPPKGQRLDIKHGGFKALLSDLNSQDSTDELTPLNDNHMPSYIGISCAVSGYSNYSPYSRKPGTTGATSSITTSTATHNRSQTSSPAMPKIEHQVHHITIDKNNIHSVDEERKELTEKLTASVTEHQRSPSPCIPHTEDDRHHGAYVGARYCPLPPPSKVVNKHIPLLGIDDEQDPDEAVDGEEKKVEQRIASLYGGDFVEDWRESMTHKAKKEHTVDQAQIDNQILKTPKDLVTLKPTPIQLTEINENTQPAIDISTPNVKVLANVEKEFLTKLLTDENPPFPSQSQPLMSKKNSNRAATTPHQIRSEQPSQSPPMSPDSGKHQSFAEEDVGEIPSSQAGEEHIEYEIRAESPVNNESSPVKIPYREPLVEVREEEEDNDDQEQEPQKLVSFSPEPTVLTEPVELLGRKSKALIEGTIIPTPATTAAKSSIDKLSSANDNNDGRYYLALLDHEKSFILGQAAQAEMILKNEEAELDDDTVGIIRSAIGKANLLTSKKCNQFKDLCEANINKNSNEQFATLNDDLAGFWDMLSIQLSDVRKSFETLWQAKESNWKIGAVRQGDDGEEFNEAEIEPSEADETRSSYKDKSAAGKSKLSAQKDQERRERLHEHINQMKQNKAAKLSAENLLDGCPFGKTEETSLHSDQRGSQSQAQSLLAEHELETQPKATIDSEMSMKQTEVETEQQLFNLVDSAGSEHQTLPVESPDLVNNEI